MKASSHRTSLLLVLAALAVAVVATTSAGGKAASKQRVSLTGTFDTTTGRGTWRLKPLSAGPLKQDHGTLAGSGKVVGRALRNGQRVTLITGGDSLIGTRGSFGISQRVESTDTGAGYSADIGTWRFEGGIGAYAGVTGGGRFAAVGRPTGVLVVSQEGWLTIGGS